ncbi:MAG: DUF502 domain-containing protein [Gemmatimonadota bacterium]|nr:MAG: DUF502 domain-containing protein [Gemmatimonadota bacterium]
MAKDKTLFQLLRRYFLTGIVVIAPVGVTAYVLWWIFANLDRILGRLFNVIGIRIPGLGLVVLVAIVIGVGWAAHQAVGREFIALGRNWLKRFPLTRTIYSAASQIVEQIVGEDRKFFKACVLVEYPRPGCWAIGFLTSEASGEISDTAQADSVSIFLPTTPNPTSGYIVFLPRAQVRRLDMSVEEGFKLVVSAGAVTPELTQQLGSDDG